MRDTMRSLIYGSFSIRTRFFQYHFQPMRVELIQYFLYHSVWERRGAHHLIHHGDTKKDRTRYSNYLQDYWHCAGILTTVNAIGTQVRNPINSGLIQWRLTAKYVDAVLKSGRNPVSKHQIQPECCREVAG